MIILPAQLESYRSLKDRSVKVVFETGELAPSQAGDIQANILKAGFLAFKSDPFTDKEKELLSSLETEYPDGKTPSQRQRNYLFRIWENNQEGFETFTQYYEYRMEKILKQLKNELDSITV